MQDNVKVEWAKNAITIDPKTGDFVTLLGDGRLDELLTAMNKASIGGMVPPWQVCLSYKHVAEILGEEAADRIWDGLSKEVWQWFNDKGEWAVYEI